MPTHVCPALDIAPQTAASAAASTSASSATIIASLPPHSMTTGVNDSAQTAMTFFAVAVEPVKAILSTPLRHRAVPVSAKPVTTVNTGCSGTACANDVASHRPIAGV